MQRWYGRRLHISWFIGWLGAGILVGAASAAVLPYQLLQNPISPLVALLLIAAGLKRRTLLFITVILCAGFLLGSWRGANLQGSLTAYKPYLGTTTEVRGIIAEDPALGTGGNQQIRLKDVSIHGQDLPGNVWVSTSSRVDIKRSDIVAFRGLLRDGFGTIPAAMYRANLVEAKRVIHGDAAREVRDWFADGVRKAVPQPESDLGIGYLVGQRSSLPEELDNNLRLLGLTHVVVASGYNLTILVRFARRSLLKVSRYSAALAAGTMIISFMLVTGLSPSMSRAGLVAGLSLGAWYFGRKIQPFVLLSISAAVTVLINPAYIWGDLGWYLSFTSFIGVIVLAPLLRTYFFGDKPRGNIIRDLLIETSSAQLLTLPLIAFTFGQYSPLALLANLLVLPLIPLAMLLTFFAGIAAILFAPLAIISGFPAYAVLRYMTAVTEWLARQPLAQAEFTFQIFGLVAGYVVLAAIIIYLWKKLRFNFASTAVTD